MAKLYFVTGRKEKFEELQEIVKDDGTDLCMYPLKIHELQTGDVNDLVQKKAFEAYKEICRPLIVEHTILKIDAFNQLPGLQTNYIFSQLGCGTIVEFCKYKDKFGACAESVFCYCDGKRYVIASAEDKGRIKENVNLMCDAFEWDRIFEPYGNNPGRKTYARMENGKNKRSMRMKAWQALKDKLGEEVLEEYRQPASKTMPVGIEPKDGFAELSELIKQKKVMLFIGAGISKSLKMPLWNELLHSLAGDEYDSQLFDTHGNNMMLAEFIRQRIPKESFFGRMKEIFTINEEIMGKLKSSTIYEAIANLGCPVIYTTNYDCLLEEYYRVNKGENSYSKVVTIADMYQIKNDAVRIMKFHGDLDYEDSVVLTESEYFKRMDFQDFMDVQLQADMLRYHILFLGYGLSDINVKMLLYMARKRQKSDSTMKSFIFTATPNQIQKAVFGENQIITFFSDDADKATGTNEFLQHLSGAANS